MIKYGNRFMHSFCIGSGFCLAASVFAVLLFFSVSEIKFGNRSLTVDSGAKSQNTSDSDVTEITVSLPSDIGFDDSEEMKKAYKEYKKKVSNKKKDNDQKSNNDENDNPVISDDTQSTTPVSSEIGVEQTTVTTTVTSQSYPTTAVNTESEDYEENSQSVSNGRQPFNYNDVSFIADDLSTLGDFLERVSPSQLSWDGSEYVENGQIKLTLESDEGIVVLDVKPVGEDFPQSEPSGSVNGEEITDLIWLEQNKSAGCNISSVTWKDAAFGIAPVRNIGIGFGLAQLTDSYLCVNGGATTLYRASDVIRDQNKLNAILAAENLYTFVGGRVYSIGSYLDKYYNGRENSFRFDDCDYVVQYGCNSIMEHNYTTGSWIIEYAVKEDTVIGISFMNKSYYRTEQKAAISTSSSSNSSSGSEYGLINTITTAHAESSEADESVPDEIPDEISYQYQTEMLAETDDIESSEIL